MDTIPETRHAWSDGVALAYQVIGDGPGIPDRWQLDRVVGT